MQSIFNHCGQRLRLWVYNHHLLWVLAEQINQELKRFSIVNTAILPAERVSNKHNSAAGWKQL